MTETTTDEPTAEPPAPTPSDDQPAAPPTRRGRAVRMFAWFGLALTVVLAIGILLGRGWLVGYVDDVFDTVDGAVANGSTVVALTTGRLEERVADLDSLVGDLQSTAATVTVPPAIAERATGIADRFGQIRDGWVAVRAKIDAALGTLAQIDRALPFVDLPPGPTEQLAALDQSIADIDANITALRSGAASRVGDVVAGATALRGAVDRVAEVGTRIEEGLAAVEDRLDRAHGTIDTVMWLTTVVLLLLVGYVALLNVLLIRGYRR
jgi:hypothetical protein